MARKKGTKPETKSEFLRRVLGRNPDLDYQQVLSRWIKAGHAGEISNALYYKIRGDLGIRTEWVWVREEKASPEPPPAEVYQLKITLLGIEPLIWRRIQVPDETLDALHEQIQTAMGWTNSHLHHFRIGKKLVADPMLLEENFDAMGYGDSTTTRLSDILSRKRGRFSFEYEYDFGDSWLHEVLFEERSPPQAGQTYPVCLDGARACPPEDVGGCWGYQDFLAAIADPQHESHAEMIEWAGRKFDPDAFSPVAATRRMKRGLPGGRS